MLVNDGSSSRFDYLMQYRHQLWYLVQEQKVIDPFQRHAFDVGIFILKVSPDYTVTKYLVFI